MYFLELICILSTSSWYFYINIQNYDSNKGTNKYVGRVHSRSCISLGNNVTLICNIFIYFCFNLGKTFQCIIRTDITDQFPITYVDFSKRIIKTETCAVRRNHSQKNKNMFLCNRPWAYFTLTGELWGVYCENFGENWPRYNGPTLYMEQPMMQSIFL